MSYKRVSERTIKTYLRVWKKLQVSKLPLKQLETISFTDFRTKTGMNSESQFRLAKALIRKPERQIEVNTQLIKEGIPITKIKRTPERALIKPAKKKKIPITKKEKALDRKQRREKAKLIEIVKEIQEKEKIKQAGTFMRMTRNLQKVNPTWSERRAIKRVRFLLKVPKIDYRKLNRKEQIILAQYGY